MGPKVPKLNGCPANSRGRCSAPPPAASAATPVLEIVPTCCLPSTPSFSKSTLATVNSRPLSIAMASSTTAVANGPARRKEPASTGTVNGSANGTPSAEWKPDEDRDFFWTYTEEPHRTRRLAIIKAHPEVSSTPIHPYTRTPFNNPIQLTSSR